MTTQTTLNARDQALTMNQSIGVNNTTYTLGQAHNYDNGGRLNKIGTVLYYLNLPSKFTKDDGSKQEVCCPALKVPRYSKLK